MKFTCAFCISLSCSPIPKMTHVLWPFSHTYVLLGSEIVAQSKRQWVMFVLGWVIVSVRDQLWDVSKLEFLSVSRLS